MSGKGIAVDTVSRRLSSLANHLVPTDSSLSSSSGLELSGAANPVNDNHHGSHDEVSQQPAVWRAVRSHDSGPEFTDIIYEKAVGEGIAKIIINRPERRNAFRPKTLKELSRAFTDASDDISIGVVILTGKGTNAFCSGGDLAPGENHGGSAAFPHHIALLRVTDLQVQIRCLPKPVIAMVAGYAVGGGHELHMLCDLTIAADNAIFGQTGAKVGSFDAGYGCSVLSRSVGPKMAREMWYTARLHSAVEAEKLGLVNAVVPVENLEEETVKWCREILRNSPAAIRVLKLSLNAIDDGHAGLMVRQLCNVPSRISDEAIEGPGEKLPLNFQNLSKRP